MAKFQSTPPVKAATITLRPFRRNAGISIHAAREGGDVSSSWFVNLNRLFQSTPPVKAATTDMGILGTTAAISIHAAREGGD